jgi:hypothetical protein
MEALMLARANERLVALKYEDAPRSWSKEAKLAFLHLPPEIQVYYAAHEKHRDRAVRRAQNEAAMARQQLAAIQKPTEVKANVDTEEVHHAVA